MALLAACKKDNKVLGVDVQPQDDALNAEFNASTPVLAYTQKYDSIASINDRYKYLGINKDPYFGTTEVGLYLAPNIPDGKTYVSFGDDANLTSSELILTVYNLGVSFIGKAGAQVTYSVFPITTAPDPAKVYYSGYDGFHQTNGSVLGVFTGSYTTLNNKVVLRIPMDNNFAKAILNNPQYLVDNATFQSIYKGFYIKSSLNGDEGIITMFDLEDDLSGFYLYYQNGTPSATKTDKVFRFTFGGVTPVRYNVVKHDFQNGSSSLQQQVSGADTLQGGNNLFLKGMGVSKVRLYLPQLSSFSDSFSVAVNRAELVLRLDPTFSTVGYKPPAKLCLLPADSVGRERYALDQVNSTDAARYDGNYDSTNKRYVFNIARHVQGILSGRKKNNGFYLVIADASSLLTYAPVYNGSTKELFLVRRDTYIERVVLAGSNQPALKPVLNMSYVKFRHD